MGNLQPKAGHLHSAIRMRLEPCYTASNYHTNMLNLDTARAVLAHPRASAVYKELALGFLKQWLHRSAVAIDAAERSNRPPDNIESARELTKQVEQLISQHDPSHQRKTPGAL